MLGMLLFFLSISLVAGALLTMYLFDSSSDTSQNGSGGTPCVSPEDPPPDISLPDLVLPEEEPGSMYVEDFIPSIEQQDAKPDSGV